MFLIENEPCVTKLYSNNTKVLPTDFIFLSKKYRLKYYFGLTEEQAAENEKMWKEENSRSMHNTMMIEDMKRRAAEMKAE